MAIYLIALFIILVVTFAPVAGGVCLDCEFHVYR